MRCYHFGNFYMSSIQQGIQAAHAQMELFVKYQDNGVMHIDDYTPTVEEYEYSDKVDMLYEWAQKYKTMICLNAGGLQDLLNIKELMGHKENTYPWSAFYEDEYSLGGLLTNISIVIPEKIYDTAHKIRTKQYLLDNNIVYENFEYSKNECNSDINSEKIFELNEFETKLINLLNSCSLAR